MNEEENTPKKYGDKEYTTYEALQRQRKLETKMRAQRPEIHLLKTGNASEDDILNAQSQYRVTSAEYTRFSKEMGLPQQRERVTVDGLGKIGANNGFVSGKTVANSGESGIIVNEESPRKNKTVDFAVDWSKIQTEEYASKFKTLSNNDKTVSSIRARAKWALNNRDGLDTEEIYAIDLTNGDEITKIIDQHHSKGVKRTPTFTRKLNEADSAGKKILLLHNHPEGLPPSIADINMLFDNMNVSGITVGHDGSVYFYTKPIKKITESDWNIAMRHFNEFSEVSAMEKSLDVLSKKYGFSFIKL